MATTHPRRGSGRGPRVAPPIAEAAAWIPCSLSAVSGCVGVASWCRAASATCSTSKLGHRDPSSASSSRSRSTRSTAATSSSSPTAAHPHLDDDDLPGIDLARQSLAGAFLRAEPDRGAVVGSNLAGVDLQSSLAPASTCGRPSCPRRTSTVPPSTTACSARCDLREARARAARFERARLVQAASRRDLSDAHSVEQAHPAEQQHGGDLTNGRLHAGWSAAWARTVRRPRGGGTFCPTTSPAPT